MTAHLSDLRELVVDGVRVFHLPGPAKTRASLYFPVGLRDETFATVGLTHLVRNLAIEQLPASRLDSSATVAVDHTEFSAYGRPDEVGDFLRRICTALADLPLDRLEQARNALVAEGSVAADRTTAVLWAARYGFTGPGLALTDGHGPLVLSGEEVLAHAAAHFGTERAALAVLGPLPEGLSLPLRSDPAASRAPLARRHPEPRRGDGPEWVEGPTEGVGLLLDGLEPFDGAAFVARAVLCERLRDVARTDRGLTYSVLQEVLDGPDGDVLALALDVREGAGADVAGLVWEQLADLAANGPTQGELDHVLVGTAAELDPADDDVVESEPDRRAFHTALDGRARPLEEVAAGRAGVTREAVRDHLAAAAQRALLVVPDGVRLPDAAQRAAPITERSWCEVASALPAGRQLRAPLVDRLRWKAARRRLVLTDESVALQDEDGTVHVVRWDEVVAVDELPHAEGGLLVMGHRFCLIPAHPRSWGQDAYDEVLRRLAPQVQRLRQVQSAQEQAASSQGGAA